jgi:hypothetical protein
LMILPLARAGEVGCNLYPSRSALIPIVPFPGSTNRGSEVKI